MRHRIPRRCFLLRFLLALGFGNTLVFGDFPLACFGTTRLTAQPEPSRSSGRCHGVLKITNPGRDVPAKSMYLGYMTSSKGQKVRSQSEPPTPPVKVVLNSPVVTPLPVTGIICMYVHIIRGGLRDTVHDVLYT